MGEQIEKQNDLRQRDGFTTFWLWLGAITNSIAIIVYIFMAVEISRIYISAASESGIVSSAVTYLWIISIFGILFSIANIWGNFLMLDWKKKGFYVRLIVLALYIVLLFIIIAVTASDSATTGSPGIGSLIGAVETLPLYTALSYLLLVIFCSLIGVAILYAVLHLRKNDKSCWKLMD